MDLEDWPQGKVERSSSTSGAGRTSFFMETSSRISPSNGQEGQRNIPNEASAERRARDFDTVSQVACFKTLCA